MLKQLVTKGHLNRSRRHNRNQWLEAEARKFQIRSRVHIFNKGGG